MAYKGKIGLLNRLLMTMLKTLGPAELDSEFNKWLERLSPPTEDNVNTIRVTMKKELLDEGGSREPFSDTRQLLQQMLRKIDIWKQSIQALLDNLQYLEEEWLERERFTERGWQDKSKEISNAFEAKDTDKGSAEWLAQLVAALDARKFDAAARVVHHDFDFPDKIRNAVSMLRAGIYDNKVDIALVESLATQLEFHGWKLPLDDRQRSNLHLVAAWLIMDESADSRRAKDSFDNRCAQHLDSAIEQDPSNAKAYAERAGLLLLQDELELGYTNSQHAIQLAPDEFEGFMQIGSWAETNTRWTEANDYYEAGLDRMSLYSIKELDATCSFLRPSGLLLTIAGEKLHGCGDDESALRLLDEALVRGVRGELTYPDARTYAARADVVRKLGHPLSEFADASLEAGSRYYWSRQYEESADWFVKSRIGRGEPIEAGWLLADAELILSGDAPNVDKEKLSKSKQTWQDWSRKKGPPSAEHSWAYLTRACIEKEFAEEGNAWLACIYAEQALIHRPRNAARWSYVSEFTSNVGLMLVGLEAAEEALGIDPEHAHGLDYKIVCLSELGRYDDAQATLRRRQELYPDGYYDAAYAWLALRTGRWDEAVEFALKGIERDPTRIFSLRQQADALTLTGKHDEARAAFRKILKLSAAGREDYLSKVLAATIAGDKDLALSWLNVARQFEAVETNDHFYSAFLALSNGDREAAKSDFQVFIESATLPWIDMLEKAALKYMDLMPGSEKHRKEHTKLIDECIKNVLPKRRELLHSKCLTSRSELADAIAAVDDETGRIALQAIRARQLIAAGKFAEGATVYLKLCNADEFKHGAYVGLSIAEAGANDTNDLQELEKVLLAQVAASYKTEYDAKFQLATAYESAGDLDEALTRFESIAGTAGDSLAGVDARAKVGDLLLRNRSFEEAYVCFRGASDTASSLNMNSILDILLIRAAVAAVAGGTREAAEADIHRAIEAMLRQQRQEERHELIPADIVPDALSEHVRVDKLTELIRMLESMRDEGESLEARYQEASKIFIMMLNFDNWEKS